MTLIAGSTDVAQRVRATLTDAAEPATFANGTVRSIDEQVETQSARNSGLQEFQLMARVNDELNGFGVLQPLLNDPEIEEIWINEPNLLRYAIGGQSFSMRVDLAPATIENLAQRLLRNSSRRVDRLHPFADATLADGSRVHVAIPPVTNAYWAINIRKFPRAVLTLADLELRGMLDVEQSRTLGEAVRSGSNILISGATAAGKTTLLAAILGELESARRVVSIEETHELRLNNLDWVAMQGRAEVISDTPAIDLRRLLRESLRMRPDYLVVGEVRGAEALDLLLAMNTGIPCAGTIHANSAAAAISKFMLLPALAQANLDQSFLQSTVLAALNLVVHVELIDGRRRVSELHWVRS